MLTGAAISTSSGIPDYRGPNGSCKREHDERSVTKAIFSDASSNNARLLALERLESAGLCVGVITQMWIDSTLRQVQRRLLIRTAVSTRNAVSAAKKAMCRAIQLFLYV